MAELLCFYEQQTIVKLLCIYEEWYIHSKIMILKHIYFLLSMLCFNPLTAYRHADIHWFMRYSYRYEIDRTCFNLVPVS